MISVIKRILAVILGLWDFFTGRSARHNRALSNLRDWSATVGKFLAEYRLEDSGGNDLLLVNIRQANFDLIALAHKGNVLVKPAAQITSFQVMPLLTRVIDEIENLRRVLLSPVVRAEELPEVVARLRLTFGNLQEKLAAIDNL